jgi:hypothetical protein
MEKVPVNCFQCPFQITGKESLRGFKKIALSKIGNELHD